MKSGICIVAMAIFVAACAAPVTKRVYIDPSLAAAETQKQRRLVFVAGVKADQRLRAVTDRLLKSGVALCGSKVENSLGFAAWNRTSFAPEWRATATSAYNLATDDRLTVTWVTQHGPADRAGILRGDVIMAIEGVATRVGKKATVINMAALGKRLKKGRGPFVLTIRRDGRIENIRVAAEQICASPAVIRQSEAVNAFADGNRVYVTQGMMRFTQSDEELALIVGHEIGHNVMLHIEKKKTNALGGGLLGLLLDGVAGAYGVNTGGGFSKMGAQAGAATYSQEFEQEADYVGLYLMEHAGYELAEAPNLWRRMAAVSPGSIAYAGSHPTTVDRFLALDKAVAEIQGKRRLNLAMRPDMEGETTNAATALAAVAPRESAGGGLAAVPPVAGAGRDLSATTSPVASLVPNTSPQSGSTGTINSHAKVSAVATLSTRPPRLYSVHLASYRKIESARNGWRLMLSEHADLLAGLNPQVTNASDSDFLLLQAGPIANQDEARALCRLLEARALYCSVAYYGGSPLN